MCRAFARGATVATLSFIVATATGATPVASQTQSVADGVYTADQATRGAAVARLCTACHGDNLEGTRTAPSLAGTDFRTRWSGKTVGDLYDKIKRWMPADDPGALTVQETVDVIAFVLRTDNLPAGDTELGVDVDRLKQIGLTAPGARGGN